MEQQEKLDADPNSESLALMATDGCEIRLSLCLSRTWP